MSGGAYGLAPLGARRNEAFAAGNLMYVMILSGRLEEARQLGSGILEAVASDLPSTPLLYEGLGHVAALRGDPETARACLSACRAWAETSEVQFRVAYGALEAAMALAEGSHRSSLEAALRAVDQALAARMPIATDGVRTAVAVAIEAARSIPDLEAADVLVSRLGSPSIGEVPPFVRAQLKRYVGLRLAQSGDSPGADDELAGSQAMFRDLKYPYWTARLQLDRAAYLAGDGHLVEAADLAAEAAATFEQLGTKPMLIRAQELVDLDAGAAPAAAHSGPCERRDRDPRARSRRTSAR